MASHTTPVYVPELTSRIAYPWNQVKLSPSDHWTAHYLLYKTIKCQATAYAWKLMSKMSKITPSTECLKEYENALLIVADNCGSTMRGMIAAKDKDGNTFHVKTTDPRLKDGTLSHFAKGTVNVRDSQGRCFKVSKDDPRYLSKELVHVRTGRVTTRSGDGVIFDTTCDDPRIATGELTHINKGYVLVMDDKGIYKRVKTTDPEYQSGVLVHARTGFSPTGLPLLLDIKSRQCSQCGKELVYKDKYHRKSAEKANRLCMSCAAKNRCAPSYIKVERSCPFCDAALHYKYAWLCKKAEDEKTTCRSCSAKLRVGLYPMPKNIRNS